MEMPGSDEPDLMCAELFDQPCPWLGDQTITAAWFVGRFHEQRSVEKNANLPVACIRTGSLQMRPLQFFRWNAATKDFRIQANKTPSFDIKYKALPDNSNQSQSVTIRVRRDVNTPVN